MAIYGEHETVEPLYSGPVRLVHSARAAGSGGAPIHVVVACEPSADMLLSSEAAQLVDAFIDSARVQQAAARTAPASWAPIYGFGRTEFGAYYVTDRYLHSLQWFASARVRVRPETLHAIVYSVIAGLRAIEDRCHRPHGNVKAANVLLTQVRGPTPGAVLTDPLPTSRVGQLRGRGMDREMLARLIYQTITHRRIQEQVWAVPDGPQWTDWDKRAGRFWFERTTELADPTRLDYPPDWTPFLALLENARPRTSRVPVKGIIAASALGLAVGGGTLALSARDWRSWLRLPPSRIGLVDPSTDKRPDPSATRRTTPADTQPAGSPTASPGGFAADRERQAHERQQEVARQQALANEAERARNADAATNAQRARDEELAGVARVRERVATAITTAEQLDAIGDAAGALAKLDEVDRLDPGNSRAAALRPLIRGRAEARAAAEAADARLKSARAAWTSGNATAALSMLAGILKDNPNHAASARLKQEIADQQLSDEVRGLVTSGLAAADDDRFDGAADALATATTKLSELTVRAPSHATAGPLGKALADARAALDRRKGAKAAWADAMAAELAGNLDAALGFYDKVLGLRPDYPQAAERRAVVAKWIDANRMFAKAQQLDAADDWAGAIAALDSLDRLFPNLAGAAELRAAVVSKVDKAKRVAGLLGEANAAIKRGDLRAALEQCQLARTLAPEDAAVKAGLAGAEAKVAQAVADALAKTRRQDAAGEGAAALETLKGIAKLDEANVEAAKLKAAIEGKLAAAETRRRDALDQLLKDARQRWTDGDPQQALALLKSASTAAEADALGQSVRRDVERAAAELADADAHYAKKEFTAALEAYGRAARGGNARAMAQLGITYRDGPGGMAKNPVEADKWLRRAAARHEATAYFPLAMLARGRDDAEAAEWLRRAADEATDAGATFYLADLYERGGVKPGGIKIPPNLPEAVTWYAQAATRRGDVLSMYRLGMMYETGRGAPANLNTARQWYGRAAAAGHTESKQWLAEHPVKPVSPPVKPPPDVPTPIPTPPPDSPFKRAPKPPPL